MGDGVVNIAGLAKRSGKQQKELTVWVHRVAVSPSLYDLDPTKTNIVFTTPIFPELKSCCKTMEDLEA